MKKDKNILLGVNVDHIATLREARGVNYPDPVQIALIAEKNGADSISTTYITKRPKHFIIRSRYPAAVS